MTQSTQVKKFEMALLIFAKIAWCVGVGMERRKREEERRQELAYFGLIKCAKHYVIAVYILRLLFSSSK